MTETLSYSKLSDFGRCPRLFRLRHVDRVHVEPSLALVWGREWHSLLERAWDSRADRFYLESEACDVPWRRVALAAMARAWTMAWDMADRLEPVAVEQAFSAPLLNMRTYHVARSATLTGRIDLIALRPGSDRVVIVEHKTTSADVSDLAGFYWQRLAVDDQAPAYFVGAVSLGYNVESVVYDVVEKPPTPIVSTPVEKRRYTKAGKLWANQSEDDESIEAYAERLEAWVGPHRAVIREIPVPHGRTEDYLRRAWETWQLMREAARRDAYPKVPGSCFMGRSRCEMFAFCWEGEPVQTAVDPW